MAKALYQSAFMGLSGRLATAQNTGFGNLRPMGLDIDLGGGFETKDVPSESEIKSVLKPGAEGYFSNTTGQFYPSYADALKDPRVKAAAQVEQTKKKLSFAPTQQPNLTIPGTPVAQRPKVTITNMQENASSGGNSSTGGNNPVPSISMPPASSSKTKVLGFLPEPLQFF